MWTETCRLSDSVSVHTDYSSVSETRMWANAQRDGRPAEIDGALCSMPQSLADAHY